METNGSGNFLHSKYVSAQKKFQKIFYQIHVHCVLNNTIARMRRAGVCVVWSVCLLVLSISFVAELGQHLKYFSHDTEADDSSMKMSSTKLAIYRVSAKNKPITDRNADVLAESLNYNQRFLITACTMVKSEAPYIVEWIEFMKIQGVERFIIYDDEASDNITLLSDLYTQNHPGSHVYVIRRIVPKHQAACFQHCVSTYGKNSDWVLIADVDEFAYSPTFGTLKDMLAALPAIEAQQNRSIDVIHINATRFSTVRPDGAQQQHRFQYALERLPGGRVVYRNGCGLQQVTSHTRRGPNPTLHPAEAAQFRALNVPANGCGIRDGWNVCWHGPGKSLFRPQHVRVAGVHYPFRWDGPGLWSHEIRPAAGRPAVNLAWCAHYYLRSVDDAWAKARYWNKSDPAVMVERSDAAFWSGVNDSVLHDRWGAAVADAMRDLVLVDGECRDGGR
jgi:hypothetical protein